ncbi:MAG: hypothetical protein GY711_27985 [bacterium]|nr:hypothetical protein [bacterium]
MGFPWSQEAYLKASNTQPDDWFGYSVAVAGDTIVVGAYREDSDATGVGGDPNNNSAEDCTGYSAYDGGGRVAASSAMSTSTQLWKTRPRSSNRRTDSSRRPRSGCGRATGACSSPLTTNFRGAARSNMRGCRWRRSAATFCERTWTSLAPASSTSARCRQPCSSDSSSRGWTPAQWHVS